MENQSALVPYVPLTQADKALLWGRLTPEVRRRQAMAAAADHDSATLCDLMHGYLLLKGRTRSYVSPHTVKCYRAATAKLLAAWTQENLLHPSQDAGDRYITALSATYSPASIDIYLAGAKALYKALRWARATTDNPFDGVTAPRNPVAKHERRRPYSQAEFDRLVGAANLGELLLLLLCGHAGLRISEALAVRWADVDTSAATIRVVNGKGGTARTVHASGTLAVALRAFHDMAPALPVIHSGKGRGYAGPTVPRQRLAALCQQAGVPYRGFHALRHLAGTRLMSQVHDLQVVAAHLGHSSIQTTTIYAHWDDSALAAAVAEW